MGAEGQVPGHAGPRAEAGAGRKCPVPAETSRPGGSLEEGPYFRQGKGLEESEEGSGGQGEAVQVENAWSILVQLWGRNILGFWAFVFCGGTEFTKAMVYEETVEQGPD